MTFERLETGTPYVSHSWRYFDPLRLFLLKTVPYEAAGRTE